MCGDACIQVLCAAEPGAEAEAWWTYGHSSWCPEFIPGLNLYSTSVFHSFVNLLTFSIFFAACHVLCVIVQRLLLSLSKGVCSTASKPVVYGHKQTR